MHSCSSGPSVSSVTLETEGPDEQQCMDALVQLIGERFGESE